MQEVNENMDELFRRAAENYPLDTSSKDWNKVMLALQNEQEVVQPVKKDNRGRFLWLLLLLPLGLICNRYVLQGDSGKGDSAKINSTATVQSKTGKSVQPETNQNKNSSTTSNGFETGMQKESPDKIQLSTNTRNSRTDKSSHQAPPPGSNIIVNDRYNKNSKINPRNTIAGNVRQTKSGNQIAVPGKSDLSGTNQRQFNSMFNDRSNELLTKSIQVRDPYQLSVNTLEASNKTIVGSEVKNKQANKKEKKFYVGLMGGVDITTIRFQKIEEAGYDYGVLLGYDLNKKWSLETGVYLDKKFYYTDGKYFNTSRVWMPPNSKITAVSGNCRMIEIPVMIKYTIAGSQKRSWFATAGANSYLMQKEDYDYTYYYGNSGNSAIHNRKYNSESKHYFASVHLSGGYARKLNKTTDLRIEPYIKLPVSGMGIGQLRFVSTGIHLGITRKLF